MQSIIKRIILVLYIIFYSADQADSIKCYSCIADNEHECYANYTKFAMDCSQKQDHSKRKREAEHGIVYNACFKFLGTVDGKQGIGRTCGFMFDYGDIEEIKRGFVDGAADNNVTLTIDKLYVCDANLCNASSFMKPAGPFLALFILTMLVVDTSALANLHF